MPETPPPAECVDFPSLVEMLSKKLSFGDREKLGTFVRGMVSAVLKAMELKTHQKYNPDEVRFCLPKTNRNLEVTVMVDLVERKEKRNALKEICLVTLKKSEYSGLPDGIKMGNDPTQIMPMVPRKKISVVDFMPNNRSLWFSVSQVLKSNKSEMAHLLQLDVEIKP